MGCNSSNQWARITERQPAVVSRIRRRRRKPHKSRRQKRRHPEVVAAKAAFEAALEEADEDQDKVVALAEAYSNCYATALLKTPGALPPEGFTSEESIFEALMPRGDGGIAPVKLLRRVDQGTRRKDQSGDDRRRAAQAAAATPAGPREGRAGGVYERREAQGAEARELVGRL